MTGKGNGKEIFTVSDRATIGEAIKVMEQKGISYLPVVDQGTIKGMVSEKNLVRHVLLGEFSQSDNISLATHQNFRIVDENELLENVANALLKKEIALVTRDDKLIDILTEIDVLQYMAKKEAL